ncbi:MAG: hypothetical protein CMJ78_20015 [Planctomycetaceae bacterium]|nr:hypothetical protein [Planctomycetaceae bacterium]
MATRRSIAAFSALLALGLLFGASQSNAAKPITKLKFDPKAEKLEFFDAIKDGNIDVKMIPKNAMGGNLLIANKTDKPISVKVPDAFVGVHVLKQFGGGGLQGGGGQLGGGGGGQTQGGGGQQGGGLGQGGGQGFFSIPPEKTVKYPYKGVCLEHGKKDPMPNMKYEIRPVETFSKDPVLRQVLVMLSSGRVDSKAAQAAAWNLSNKMGWRQLATKQVPHLGGRPSTPFFTRNQILWGQNLVAAAKIRAEEEAARKDGTPAEKPKTTPARTRTGARVSLR